MSGNPSLQPARTVIGVSPLLKGGRALSQTVQHLVNSGSKTGELGLVKSTSVKHVKNLGFQRPKPAYSCSSKDQNSVLLQTRAWEYGPNAPFGDGVDGIHQSLSVCASPVGPNCSSDMKQVDALRRSLSQHEEKMQEMNEQLLRVRNERDAAVRSNIRLRECVHSHQNLLQRTLHHTQRALQEQTQILVKQDTLIQGILRERLNESGLVDLACVLVSVYVVRTPVMKYTISLVTSYVTRRHTHAHWFPKWFQYFAVLQTYALLKLFFRKTRFASRVGSSVSWLLSRSRSLGSSFLNIGEVCASALSRGGSTSEDTKPKSLHLC